MKSSEVIYEAERVDILSEEPDYAATTAAYGLRLKTVQRCVSKVTGWMGSAYYRNGTDTEHFSANTGVLPNRDEALIEGTKLIERLQNRLDAGVSRVKQSIPSEK